MRSMIQRIFVGVFFCVLAGAGSAQEQSQVPPEPGDMQLLFNGQNLDGWNGDSRLWSVRDGVIHGETTEANKAQGNTFLIWTDGETKDFDLRLSFRCNSTNNSGIQYRSKHIQEGSPSNAWVVKGYQHEVRNETTFPDVPSFIYDEGGQRGRLCLTGETAIWEEGKKKSLKTLFDQAAFEKLMHIDDWNDVVILAQGNRLRHYLNGQLVLDFEDRDPKLALLSGVLALQLHAGAPMWVEFRNIRIKHL